MNRKDLTFLKVYVIDVDEADEVNQNTLLFHLLIQLKFLYDLRPSSVPFHDHYFYAQSGCEQQLDDALSAMRLQDGRIRIWIHVADPTCYVQPQSIMDRSPDQLRKKSPWLLLNKIAHEK